MHIFKSNILHAYLFLIEKLRKLETLKSFFSSRGAIFFQVIHRLRYRFYMVFQFAGSNIYCFIILIFMKVLYIIY
jgi:hypothetical protein